MFLFTALRFEVTVKELLEISYPKLTLLSDKNKFYKIAFAQRLKFWSFNI